MNGLLPFCRIDGTSEVMVAAARVDRIPVCNEFGLHHLFYYFGRQNIGYFSRGGDLDVAPWVDQLGGFKQRQHTLSTGF